MDLKSDIYSTNNRVWTQRMLKEYKNLRGLEAGDDPEDGPLFSQSLRAVMKHFLKSEAALSTTPTRTRKY